MGSPVEKEEKAFKKLNLMDALKHINLLIFVQLGFTVQSITSQ